MQITPYLLFNGNCEAAFQFYEKALGGQIQFLTRVGESPAAPHMPADMKDKILHVRLTVGDAILLASDAPPDRFEPMKGSSVSLLITEPDEADRVFAALSENGQITMPIGQTFWARRFGAVTDQFGTSWMINCE